MTDFFELEDYKVDKKRIGKGSFSTIYKAINIYDNKTYAIKEISVENIKSIKKNIKREFLLMKKLNHINIINLYNVIFDAKFNNIYLVLDYHKLGVFKIFLNKRPLKEIYAQKYLKQLADGLKYLLDNNIIHRDLKPQNILVTESYNIKITDFGFARYFDNDAMIHTLCGSPMYMAPEIMKNKKYNNKSDLWSVGVILYEMLTATVPHKAKNIVELINKIDKNPIKLPKFVKINSFGMDLLNLLLQKDPLKRISWEDFFSHEWIKNDRILEKENKFLEISFNNSLPNLEDMKISSQFYNFHHNSISQNESTKTDVSFDHADLFENSEQDIENSESDSDSYLSANEEHNPMLLNDDLDLDENYFSENIPTKSKPIDIEPNKQYGATRKDYVYVTNDMVKSYNRKGNEHMFNSNVNINNGYVLVNRSPELKTLSEPVYTIKSPSFKEVINTSLNVLKASYEYVISNNKSI